MDPDSGRRINCHDERNHLTVSQARVHRDAGRVQGFGLVLEPAMGLACLDVDEGATTESREKIAKLRGVAWIERSPSGSGEHWWVRTTPGLDLNQHRQVIGVYSARQYITITEQVVEDSAVAPGFVALEDFLDLVRDLHGEVTEPRARTATEGLWEPNEEEPEYDIELALDEAWKARNKPRFKLLHTEGRWDEVRNAEGNQRYKYPSHAVLAASQDWKYFLWRTHGYLDVDPGDFAHRPGVVETVIEAVEGTGFYARLVKDQGAARAKKMVAAAAQNSDILLDWEEKGVLGLIEIRPAEDKLLSALAEVFAHDIGRVTEDFDISARIPSSFSGPAEIRDLTGMPKSTAQYRLKMAVERSGYMLLDEDGRYGWSEEGREKVVAEVRSILAFSGRLQVPSARDYVFQLRAEQIRREEKKRYWREKEEKKRARSGSRGAGQVGQPVPGHGRGGDGQESVVTGIPPTITIGTADRQPTDHEHIDPPDPRSGAPPASPGPSLQTSGSRPPEVAWGRTVSRPRRDVTLKELKGLVYLPAWLEDLLRTLGLRTEYRTPCFFKDDSVSDQHRSLYDEAKAAFENDEPLPRGWRNGHRREYLYSLDEVVKLAKAHPERYRKSVARKLASITARDRNPILRDHLLKLDLEDFEAKVINVSEGAEIRAAT